MMLRKWEDLPEEMQNDDVKYYYDALSKKKVSLFFKRCFDVVVSFLMLVILSPVFLILAAVIKLDSKGPVFYRQTRITQYGKEFKIHKFRSMVQNADRGLQVTVDSDSRITKVGKFIRRCRLDEISQLIDVLEGTMTFVGTRPEVPRYTAHYTPKMKATYLLPAGVTSETSIYYKDEADLLDSAEDAEKTYIEQVLPGKMKYNLKSIENFGFFRDIKIMFMTFFAVLGKKYTAENEEEKVVEFSAGKTDDENAKQSTKTNEV